ncbi:DUF4382 domain-containing protein [Pseudidiomarina mangrovi]|uniref:DUF4382 domain-containing protein n=1 Tax=Pseudidiomarina mangrovi TaxID=2487133 RepID=UPI00196B0BCE|nr:DUF4382 domain-containing protein [Pseudidiomarina mangrovi]CAI8158752.1 MAG: Uncharacterised protein [Pseudidiomarina mangrovi]
MLTKMKLVPYLTAVTAALTLAGCGSSDDPDTAVFSLAVSDAPVDSADAVWACFSAIELIGNEQGTQVFTIGEDSNTIASNDVCKDSNGATIPNTHGLDLLTFTGSDSETILNGVEVAAGVYSQIRLVMAAGSFVQVGDQQIPLSVPSNELKFDGVTLSAGGQANYTVEFDLRQALVDPVGQAGYFLKPRGVRLVDNAMIGHIEGSIAEALLISNQCTVAPTDVGVPVASVYVYPGHGLDATTLADIGGSETLEPYAVTGVYYDNVSAYDFAIGFVDQGDYTAAWTCQIDDDPEADDVIEFIGSSEIQVGADGSVVRVDFSAG